MTDGIYTLANDSVYDQLVAFLNSVTTNDDRNLEVCVIPYDHSVERVRKLASEYPGVTLFEDEEALSTWLEFSNRAWSTHSGAMARWEKKYGRRVVHREACHLRYAAFDDRAPFDRFVYFDADVLLLDSLRRFFDHLNDADFVTYDFQFKHAQHVFNLDSELLPGLFDENRIRREVFCSGCFASRRGLFDTDEREWMLSRLAAGESDVLYPNAPDQTLLNYMAMRSNKRVDNLAHSLPRDQVTGSAVTSRHFERAGGWLFDHGKRVNYLHYVGVVNEKLTRLSAGERIEVPYPELFLHYRFQRAEPSEYG